MFLAMIEALYKPIRGEIRMSIASSLTQRGASLSTPPLIVERLYDGSGWVEVASTEGQALLREIYLEAQKY